MSALAAERANEPGTRRRNASATATKVADERTAGEIAALVFERLEQRQSLAEVVVGLRVTPDLVRGLFDQWTLGLTEGQLRMAREPTVSRDNDTPPSVSTLATRWPHFPKVKPRASASLAIEDRFSTAIASTPTFRSSVASSSRARASATRSHDALVAVSTASRRMASIRLVFVGSLLSRISAASDRGSHGGGIRT